MEFDVSVQQWVEAWPGIWNSRARAAAVRKLGCVVNCGADLCCFFGTCKSDGRATDGALQSSQSLS